MRNRFFGRLAMMVICSIFFTGNLIARDGEHPIKRERPPVEKIISKLLKRLVGPTESMLSIPKP